MAVKIKFIKDNGIYGKSECDGYATHEDSAFVIYKGHKNWTIGHRGTGLSVDTLIQPTYHRTKRTITDLIEHIERAVPQACEDMQKAIWPLTKYQKEALNEIAQAAREYQA